MTVRSPCRPSSRLRLQLEQLETRVLPTAVLVDSFHVQYRDLDDDIVTIRATQPIFPSVAAASAILTFKDDTNTVVATPFTGGLATNPAYVSLVDLTTLGAMRLSLQIVVTTRSATGDGLAEVGRIDNTVAAVALQRVAVGGRLWEIDSAGDVRSLATIYLGTGSISPLSLGAADFAGSTSISNIVGSIGNFAVVKNIDNAFLDVGAQIRRGVIAGDIGVDPLIGGTASDPDTSAIHADTLGSFEVRGNLYGGTGLRSGSIRANTTIGSIFVKKDLVGGSAKESGRIRSNGDMRTAGVYGNLFGGSDDDTGQISADGHIKYLFVQRDLVGGSGDRSAHLASASDAIDLVRVGGSVIGGDGDDSGEVEAATTLKNVSITGDVRGGTGKGSGVVEADVLTKALVRGSLIGGGTMVGVDGALSGYIIAGSVMTEVKVVGDVIGGLGDDSGKIESLGTIGKVTVIGDVQGGEGYASGTIVSTGVMTTVQVFGDLAGAAGSNSGRVESVSDIDSVTIHGAVRGAAGSDSGKISAGGDITGTIKVYQSVFGFGTTAGMISAVGDINIIFVNMDLDAGYISGGGTIASVRIRNILGGAPTSSGSVLADGTISNVFIRDSILAGTGDNTGVIHSGGDLTKVFVENDLDGTGRLHLGTSVQVGPGSAVISADANIDSLEIDGQVLGGNNDNTGAIFGDADDDGSGDIGTLILGNIVGGSSYGGHGVFGQTVINTGYVQAVNIDIVGVGGNVSSGGNGGLELFNSGCIRVLDTLGTVNIAGDFRGNLESRPTISALNHIVSLTFKHQVENADILVGYSPDIYVNYEPTGDLDATGGVVYGPFLLNIVDGLPMDASDATQFNGSAVLDTLTATRSWGLTNLVVSVDPVDGLLGNSDDDTKSGSIGTASFNGKFGIDFGRPDFTYVIAASAYGSLSGKALGATPSNFTEADATLIGVAAFNILTHANLNFATDTNFVLLYK